jgi:hypothetical protein
MPFTGELYQDLAIGLTGEDPPADPVSWMGLNYCHIPVVSLLAVCLSSGYLRYPRVQ